MQELKLPKRGQAMEEGTVVEWVVEEGERVSVDDPIVLFEADKATYEISAEQEGVLLAKRVEAGETVSIGTTLGYVGEENEAGDVRNDASSDPDTVEIESNTVPAEPEAAITATTDVDTGGPAAESGALTVSDDAKIRASPSARRAARAHGVTVDAVGTELGVRQVRERDVKQFVNGRDGSESDSSNGEEIRGSPAARRIADSYGVGIASVGESLQKTRVRMADVEKYAEGTASSDQSVTGAESTTVEDTESESLSSGTSIERAVRDTVPITGTRQVMFDRMQTVATEYGSTTTIARVDVTELVELQESLAESWSAYHDVTPSVTAFVVRAVAEALSEYRMLNAEIVEPDDPNEPATVRLFDDINVGIAVDTDHGLLVPTIHHADNRTTKELSEEVDRLATDARNRNLDGDQQRNGTFTVSNAGTFGAYINTPQINPPQTGILGICTISEEPGVVGGEVVPREIMHLSLTYDHRVVEGSTAVQFLQTVKNRLEEPQSLLS